VPRDGCVHPELLRQADRGATAQVGGTLLLLNPLRLGAAPAPTSFLTEHDAEIARLWLVGGRAALPSALRAELE
jgi:hypothetical protein